jgi:hypothetical protein
MIKYGLDMVSTDDEQKVFVGLIAPALAVLFASMGYRFSYGISGKVISVDVEKVAEQAA